MTARFFQTIMTPRQKSISLRGLVICAIACSAPVLVQAQVSASVDAPSRNAETRRQHDSLTVHFLRTPKGKPAALSVGGRTSAQSRKFSGKPAADLRSEPVETPLPVRASSTKP